MENILNNQILQFTFGGNTLLDYIISLILFLLFYSLLRLFRRVLISKIVKRGERKKEGTLERELVEVIKSFGVSFYFYLSLYFALTLSLELPSLFKNILDGILIILIAIRAVIALSIMTDWGMEKFLLEEKDPGSKTALKNIGKIAKGLLWLFAFLLVLSNFGVEITALIAGLGVGGIAIAFALQNILSDLFSSFAIYFDKPFTVGDFVIVGDDAGIVEKIGIKTTRLRALQGEEIVMSNRELTNARVHNFKKMEKRRVTFRFGVIYATPVEKMKKIPGMVKDIIEKEELAEFNRASFINFGDFSLDYEVVYYILSGDFLDYTDTHQNILLKIKEKTEKEGIEMAFPTRTIHLSKD